MEQFTQQQFKSDLGLTSAEIDNALSDVLSRVYGLMTVGLMLTAVIAWFVSRSETFVNLIFGTGYTYLAIFGLELLLVIWLTRTIGKYSPATSTAMFLGYSALNGITMAAIFLVYSLPSIGVVFAITAGMFAVMSLIGFTTKVNMGQYSGFFLMGLVGFIIATIVNIWLQNPALYWLLTYFGIALFLGLTIYDTQRIKEWTIQSVAVEGPNGPSVPSIAVMGALALYLDFINLFILLLRVFGRRN